MEVASPEELTSELRQQLAYERVNFDRWCDERRAQLDGLEQKHQLNMAQAQATLQALSVNEQNIAQRVEEAAQVRSKHTALLAEETARRDALMQEHEEMTPKARSPPPRAALARTTSPRSISRRDVLARARARAPRRSRRCIASAPRRRPRSRRSATAAPRRRATSRSGSTT